MNSVEGKATLVQRDRLERYMADQAAFQSAVLALRYSATLDGADAARRETIAKDYVLAMVDELMEFLRHLDWKSHRFMRDRKPFDREQVIEELVDVGKFWINLLLLYCPDLDEFDRAWDRKTAKVIQRFKVDVASMTGIGDHLGGGAT